MNNLRTQFTYRRIRYTPLLAIVIVRLIANRHLKITTVKVIDECNVVRVSNIVNHDPAHSFQVDESVNAPKKPGESDTLRFRPFVVAAVVKIVCFIVRVEEGREAFSHDLFKVITAVEDEPTVLVPDRERTGAKNVQFFK